MLNIVNVIPLVALNIIALIFFYVKSSSRKQTPSEKVYYQKLLENQNQLYNEMTELRQAIEQQHKLLKQEFEQLRAERKTLAAAVQTAGKQVNDSYHFEKDRYKEIFELHEQGLTTEEIAAKLDKGSGEVAFILQLGAKGRN